jgi:photosystem II stability/assembly factor-like uncharacterized protein
MLSALCCGIALLSAGIARAGIWMSNGPNGGLIDAIAVDPSTPTTVYAGTDRGGLFKSVDGGDTWRTISLTIPDVESTVFTGVAVDPTTPARIYATSTFRLDGRIFRSTDGGATWSFTSTPFMQAVAIDPVTPTTVYAVGNGVLKSTDAGTNWTTVLPGGSGGWFAVAIDPVTPRTVYIGGIAGLRRTTDGGATWTPVFGAGEEPILALAIDPTRPNVVYAGAEDAGVFKTIDGGDTWTPLGPDVGGQNLTIHALGIDPQRPDTVYAAGLTVNGGLSVYKTTNGGTTWAGTPLTQIVSSFAVDPAHPETLFAGTSDPGIWKSDDGGAHWREANAGLVNTGVASLAIGGAPGVAWAATDRNGVARTTNGGASWAPTASIRVSGVLLALGADPTTPDTAYVGTSLNGVFKTVDGGGSWAPLLGGEAPALVTALVVDPSSPSIVYAAGLGGVFVSTIGGGAWTRVSTGLLPFVFSMTIDPSSPATLYAGTVMASTGGVFKTTNGGSTWTPVNTGLPFIDNAAVTALALDPSAPATLYAAIETAGVFKTVDGGATWSAANGGLGADRVTSLAVHPTLPNTVYAGTLDHGVFTSTDGGASWTPTNDGLFNHFVAALAVDPDRIYAGTGGDGAFVMTTGAVTTTSTSTTTSTTSPQALLGKLLDVRNPSAVDPSRRSVVVQAKETASNDVLDPAMLVANGASVTVAVDGATPSKQTFAMPAPWTRLGTTGARYTDKHGLHGPVRLAQVAKSASGTFTMRVEIVGKNGLGAVRPPNPGSGGSALLRIDGDAAYCVGFGGAAGGRIADKGPAAFKVTNPTRQACSP